MGTGAAKTAYVYDQDGHLLAEHNATTGAVTREYVWLDDRPVALLTFAGGVQTTSFLHTGQIDEPLALTSTSRALKWNGYLEPYGAATTFAAPAVAVDMRLPGQSFQLEAGSPHQNGYRDYDPSLGRYIETDPLGIEAGQNVYGYVDRDPLGRVPGGGVARLANRASHLGAIAIERHSGGHQGSSIGLGRPNQP